MRMVIIDKRPWAVGLDWSSTRLEKLSKLQLLQKAQKIDPDFDMMVEQRNLYGFGASGGQPENWLKARSLAAFLDLPPSFLGLFALEDATGETFWWVICRQDGQNVGQGDAVYKTRKEAETEFKSLSELLDSFEEVVTLDDAQASIGWLEPLLHVNPLALLNRRGCIESLLPSGKSRFPWIYVGAGVFSLCILTIVLNAWFERQAAKESAEAARIAMLDKAQRQQFLLDHPETQFPQPWTDAPLAVEQAIPCLQTMLPLPVVVNGWLLLDAECTKQNVAITWEHQPQADFLNLPFNGWLKSPQQAVSKVILKTVAPARKEQRYPGLLPQKAASQYLFQLTQSSGAKLRLSFQAKEKRTVQQVEVVAPWARGDWELSMISGVFIRNEQFWQSLTDIPGLTLEKISVKKEMWTLQGQIYATGR